MTMKGLFFAIAVLAACALANEQHDLFQRAVERSQADGGNTWVVLVAGSTGWGNYRHQSSVCKAYQLAHQAGVPDEHIITFMADDIANNTQNPFPGKIFNEIYVEGGNNVNVYEGVVKDYIAKQASTKNLVNVLSGNPTTGGSGKTLRSTADDNVFVFYDDHGNSGIIGMPTGELFHDYDLATAFKAMEEKKMFKNLIFFMSACYSGSMFYKQNLPKNVYVATSAPTSTSSYACLRDSKLRTFLSSCWPHGWIHSIDEHGLNTDFGTIFEDSYNYARDNSPTVPCQYGDLDMKQKTFLGFMKNTDKFSARRTFSAKPVHDKTAVPQYLVPYVLAKENYENEPTEANYAAFKAEAETRLRVDRMVTEIVNQAMPNNAFLATAVCDTCDESCDCYSSCIKTGSVDHCSRYCCDYAACTGSKLQNDDEISCALTLQRAFTESLDAELQQHPYILSAGIQFNRLCRSGANIPAALSAINRIAH